MYNQHWDTSAISLYGMRFKPDAKTQRTYQKQLERCKQILGDKYLLANPITKKELTNV